MKRVEARARAASLSNRPVAEVPATNAAKRSDGQAVSASISADVVFSPRLSKAKDELARLLKDMERR